MLNDRKSTANGKGNSKKKQNKNKNKKTIRPTLLEATICLQLLCLYSGPQGYTSIVHEGEHACIHKCIFMYCLATVGGCLMRSTLDLTKQRADIEHTHTHTLG